MCLNQIINSCQSGSIGTEYTGQELVKRENDLLYYELTWEPSACPGYYKVTPTVYLNLNDFTGKLNFRY